MSTQSFVSDDVIPITPSDTVVFRAGVIKCTGTGGNLVIKTLAGNTRTVPVLTDGTIPAMCTQVLAATTATGLYLYPAV